MKPKSANTLNAIVLILAGLYGYFLLPLGAEEQRSWTALIPSISGVIFLIIGQGWDANPKIAAHSAAVLALILIVMCLLRFVKIEEWGAKKAVFLVCILSNAFALGIFVKSFIDARRTRS